MAEKELLNPLLRQMFDGRPYSVCVQDTSGIHGRPGALRLDDEFRIHTAPVCRVAKSTAAGWARCARMKQIGLDRLRPGASAEICRCPLGLAEVMKPVYQGSALVCVLYIGQFITDDPVEIRRRMARVAPAYGVAPNALWDALDKTPAASPETLSEMRRLAECLAEMILMAMDRSGVRVTASGRRHAVSRSALPGVDADMVYVREYIDRHYRRPLRLEDLARTMYLHPDYLSRLFKKKIGQTFSAYLAGRRLQEAARLMRESPATITDIAAAVGFAGKANFNRLFKRTYGCTPREYRAGSPGNNP